MLDHIGSFVNYLKRVKNYSEHTLTAYQSDLDSLHYYIENQYNINEPAMISHTMIRSWIFELKKSDTSNRSINRKISSISSFFKYLMLEGKIIKNPLNKVTSLKIEKRLPQYIVEREIDQIIEMERPQIDDDFIIVRDKLIIHILYATGMRRSELLNLKESDIDFGRKEVKVMGKGKKERIIPVQEELLDSIQKYREKKSALHVFTASNGSIPYTIQLICTEKGAKMNARALYKIVHDKLYTADSVERKSPHILRHSFATHLLENGAEISAIKELLGHTGLGATQVYTHNNIKRLQEVYRKSHPKA